MADKQKLNKPLFSQHFLDHRLPECPEWQIDMTSKFETLQNLYSSKRDLLPTLNEAQTEDIFIQPVLGIMGFSYIPQVKTSGKGRAERPDYALFAAESERDSAYPLQHDEPAFYARVSCIAEAKYWERSLNKVSANDKRDIYKNQNPSFQIASYLIGTGVDWGILTNGREWRLYYRLASSRATEFYQVDLVELLEAEDIERFKYFWLFFRQEAFVKDSQGRNFLERVREGSTTYSTKVGDELKTLVFNSLFPDLAGGFVAAATRQQETVLPEKVYEATLSFLYKLLFLLYAEARNLLPVDGDYRDYSLTRLTQEIAPSIDTQKNLSQTSTAMHDRLLNLFKIIDCGDVGLGVPRYNGGLFHFQSGNKDSANDFLARYKLTDALLAPVLDRLARFEGLPIDYGFLGVRQLGSIYEGLLEYRVVIEDAATGKVHLENDKGERKATGSYYTPEYIVKYIVSHAVKPVLAGREERFKELMAEIGELRDRLQDKRLGKQSINGLQKDLQRLERKAQSALLDIKVCDPAMGSGHFLVEAVDYLTDELIGILNQYPENNPVLAMLEATRQGILANLEEQGIAINPDKLEPVQLLQRVVMKRCIYGVDLNPMAVELAKVSLWLHSFTIGAPLSFLDHHLRCGNSLIGTTAREAEAEMTRDKSGQLSLLTGPFVGLLKAAEVMRGVSVLSDATFAEVEQSERLFRGFDEAAKPYKRLLDVYVSQFFGVKQAKSFLERFGTDAITVNPGKMKKADRAVYEEAQKLGDQRRFFHWDLEFPEVFIDLESASWQENGGFDVVVGNPPYGDILDKQSKDYLIAVTGMRTGGRAEVYSNFIVLSISVTKSQGYQSFIIPNTCLDGSQFSGFRKIISDSTEIVSIRDFRNKKVFREADVMTAIIVIKNSVESLRDCYTINYDIWNDKNQDLLRKEASILLNSEEPWRPSDPIISKIENANICVKLEPEIGTCHDAGVDYKWKNVGWQNRGKQTSLSKLLFYSGEKRNERDYELLKGENLNRYSIGYENNYLIYDFEKHKNPQTVVSVYLELNLVPVKILTRQTSDSIQASVDCQQFVTSKSIHTTIVRNENYSAWYLVSLLNSQLLTYIYRALSGEKGRTFAQVKLHDLRQLLIRKINFTTPSDRRQKSLENLINLYQTNNNPEPILNQVNYHLNQQPEEADIVRDFLAYLAEQMLELNQQKQSEIQSFLQWLERFLGSPIDQLNNKTKINNYLGDYYKDEPHLSFDDLIAVLKKNKKKIKIDPVGRKDQQTLEKEYQGSLEELLPLKTQLKQCDKLIDKIVYQLYGLTEEEIAIVEGR
jgi:hypothetical protein